MGVRTCRVRSVERRAGSEIEVGEGGSAERRDDTRSFLVEGIGIELFLEVGMVIERQWWW